MEIRKILSYSAYGMKKENYLHSSLKWKSGSVLSFQPVSRLVFSALKGLTSVFGMGTGGTPSLLPPETVYHSFAP